MNNEEQRIYYERKLEVLEKDYNRVRATTNALRCDISDLSFEERVQDPQERYLLVEKLKTLEGVQTNMLNLIRFYRHKVNANKPEPWEEANAIRTINTPCGPVNLVNQDKVSKEELCEMTHHCGQDADMDDACCQVKGVKPAITGESLRNLMGMQVCRCNVPCDVCAIDKRLGACVKLELVGGDYICLAPTPNTTTEIDDSPKSFEEAYRDSMNILREFCIKQSEANQRLVNALKEESEELKKPVINFDEEESNVMADIKDKTEAFMDYLESVVKSRTHGLG